MIKYLRAIGLENVDAAWDGSEAVRLVKQKPLSYNVILMDINMPVMKGIQATQAIRTMEIDVPIIAVTGNAIEGNAEDYFNAGMNVYIAKSVFRRRLEEVLLKWIGKS